MENHYKFYPDLFGQNDETRDATDCDYIEQLMLLGLVLADIKRKIRRIGERLRDKDHVTLHHHVHRG
jgi:hypothetical protein